MTNPLTIFPKDLRAGDTVIYEGHRAKVHSRARGVRICLDAFGEGPRDAYTKGLQFRLNVDGTKTRIVLEKKHQSQFDLIRAAGF